MFPGGWWTASRKPVSVPRSSFVKCQSEMESDRQSLLGLPKPYALCYHKLFSGVGRRRRRSTSIVWKNAFALRRAQPTVKSPPCDKCVHGSRAFFAIRNTKRNERHLPCHTKDPCTSQLRTTLPPRLNIQSK